MTLVPQSSSTRTRIQAAVCATFAVACFMLAINGLVQAAEVVGDLGAADRLVVRGLKTIPSDSLRDGLLEDADLYWRGLPSADRDEYLESLQVRSTLALQAIGFPEPRVTVTTERRDDGTEMIAIDVVEGPRTMMGPIRVTGLPDDLAARLDAYLRNEQPPVDAERETFVFPDGTTNTRWRTPTGDTVKLLDPVWEPEEPANFATPGHFAIYRRIADFFRHEGYFEIGGMTCVDTAAGFARMRERFDVALLREHGQATLVIDVPTLPTKSVLKAIEISKDLRTTSEELQTYLDIEIGKPVTDADRVTWLEKLRDSGRFLSQAVSFKSAPGGVEAIFELVEYADGRPLADPPSKEEESLRRCREWFMSKWYSGHEIRISATHENHARGTGALPVELDAVIGRNAGCVGVLRVGEDQYGISLWHDKLGLYGPTARLTAWLPGRMAPYFTARSAIRLDDEDDVQSRPRGFLSLGAAVNTKKREHQLTIEPVCCAYAANTTTSSMDGDVLVIEYGGESDDSAEPGHAGTMRIDPVTGQCLGGSDGAWVFTVTTGKGTGAEVIASLEAASGPNVAAGERPVAAIGAFFISACTSLPTALRGVVDDDTLDGYQQASNFYAEWIRRVLDRLVPARVDAAVADLLGSSIWQSSDESLAIPVAEENLRERIQSARTIETSHFASQLAPPILRRVENRYGRSAWPVVAARLGALMYAEDQKDSWLKEFLRLHRSGGLAEIVDGLAKILGEDSSTIKQLREGIASLPKAMEQMQRLSRDAESVHLSMSEELERLEKVAGLHSKDALSMRLLLARALADKGRRSEANTLLEQVVDAEVTGDVDRALFNATHFILVEMLMEANEYAKAVRYAEKLLSRAKTGQDDGMKPAAIATIRQTIAYCLAMTGEVEKSLALYQELLAETEKEHGEKHPETTKLLLNVISLLNQSGREHEAYALNRRLRVEIERRAIKGLEPPSPASRKLPPVLGARTPLSSEKKDNNESEPPKAEDWKGFELPGIQVR